MNTTQIKCFLTLGQTLNFSKTAKILYIAQSTVSKNISNLEDELKVQLFSRKHRQIKLTESGKYFYQQMSQVDLHVEEIIDNLHQINTIENNSISIGYTGLPFEQKYLPIFIKKIREKTNWNVNLVQVSLSKENIVTDLKKHKIDFMIYQQDFFDNKEDFGFYPIMSAGFSVLIRRDSELAKFKRIPISELHKYKVFLWDGRTPLNSVKLLKDQIQMSYTDQDQQLEVIHKASLAKIIVLSQTGIAVVPSFVYDHNNPDFYYRYLDYGPSITYGLGYLKETEKSNFYSETTNAMKQAISICKYLWDNEKS